jgi:hypothetical protein
LEEIQIGEKIHSMMKNNEQENFSRVEKQANVFRNFALSYKTDEDDLKKRLIQLRNTLENENDMALQKQRLEFGEFSRITQRKLKEIYDIENSLGRNQPVFLFLSFIYSFIYLIRLWTLIFLFIKLINLTLPM